MKQTCLAICALVGVASDLFGTDLRDVIAHSEKYDNRRITVVGIARVPGYFYLCADEKAAADKHPSIALLVRKNNHTQPEYRELDRQWVEITGVVTDKKLNGYELAPMSGPSTGICLERIRVLRDRPRPRIKDSTVLGIFKNTMSQPVAIQLLPRVVPGIGTIFFLAPNEAQENEVDEGKVVALQLHGKERHLDRRKTGAPVASGDISFRTLPRGYGYSLESSEQRRLYFRIVDHRIEPVAASEGRTWKLP